MDTRQKQIIADCEASGEDEIRRRYNASEISAPRDQRLVKGWLREREASRCDAREEKALKIARRVKTISIIGIIVSAIIAIMVFIFQ